MAKTLFDASLFAACSVAAAPLRREAAHRSEQTSQILFGERATVLEHNEESGWARIRCAWDDYEGWCRWGQLRRITHKDFTAAKRLIVTGHNACLRMDEGSISLPLGSELTGLRAGLLPANEGSTGKFSGQKADIRALAFSPQVLLACCRTFLHAPYLWGGRTPDGIDCSGLVQMAFKACGVPVLRDAAQQAGMGIEVHFLQESEPGDLAFFDNDEGRITHVGILADTHTIIHATDTAGRVVIDTIDSAGIISRSLKRRTHKLRALRRIRPVLTAD